MSFMLEFYTTIYNSDEIVYPSEVREMLNKIKSEKDLTSAENLIIETVYSFYKLGFENKSKKS